MRTLLLTSSVAALLLAPPMHAAVQFPLLLTLDAQFKSGATTVSSQLTIRVDRAMIDPIRARVTDGLKFGGYPGFLNALRSAPELGSIKTQSAEVVIRYTREDPDGAGSRLVLVADRPLFFVSRDPAKAKAGYELTLVDLRFDDRGGVTGQMSGAARVKPGGDGAVILDTWAEEPVQLKGTVGKP